MNTKDNQESEREAFEKWAIKQYSYSSCKRVGDGYYHAILESAWEAWQARATLTTPKVNEEVASGEAVIDKAAYDGAREDLAIWKKRALEAEEKVRVYDKRIVDIGVIAMTPITTPSPYNVLVEALEVIANGKLIATGCRNVAKLALATYSASTDSVSVPMDDRARLEHIFKTNPTIYLAHNFDSWIEAIDTARKSS